MDTIWLAVPIVLALPLFFSTMLFSVVVSRVQPADSRESDVKANVDTGLNLPSAR